MANEFEQDVARAQDEFESLIFATSVAGHMPGLYTEMFGEGDEDSPVNERQVEWTTPNSPDDLDEFKRAMLERGYAV